MTSEEKSQTDYYEIKCDCCYKFIGWCEKESVEPVMICCVCYEEMDCF